MVIKILKKKNVKGSCYIEFMPGKWDEICWKANSIYFTEEVFSLIEPVIFKYFKNFYYYGFNDISRNTWVKIILQLEKTKDLLESECSQKELKFRLKFLFDTYKSNYEMIIRNRKPLAEMIKQLVFWLKTENMKNTHISILGM